MPRRNLLILIIVTLLAVLCCQHVQENPYGWVLANAMTTIENRYLEPVEDSKLFEGAMYGMVEELDSNSAYISPAGLKDFNKQLDQKFVGVGIKPSLDPNTKQLMVLVPLLGSPALKAGVRAGDKILRIGTASTQGMSLEDAARLLQGEPGVPVTLSVLHEGDEKPVDIKIVRDTIQIESVMGDLHKADGGWDFFLEGRERIGYVRHQRVHRKTRLRIDGCVDLSEGAGHARPGAGSPRRSGRVSQRGHRRLQLVHRFGRDRDDPPPRRPSGEDLFRQRQAPLSSIFPWPCLSISKAPRRGNRRRVPAR